MTTTTQARSKFDASAAAAGYLFQVRYALLLAVARDDSSDLLSLELLDDVAFTSQDLNTAKPTDVLQFKHSLSPTVTLTDKSVDLWKTLRVWSDLVHSKRLDPHRTIFTLVTTAAAPSNTAVCFLRSESSRLGEPRTRDPKHALTGIEAAGTESTNETVIEAAKSLSRLSLPQKMALFSNIYLLDASPNVNHARTLIEHELRYLVDDPQYQLPGFTDRLEGWWFRKVVDHLVTSRNAPIPVAEIHSQIRELREQFKRDSLPDDFLGAVVPDDRQQPDDDRCFVNQLRLIKAGPRLIRSAQESHYRAYEQRSRWVRETLLGLTEVAEYERRLVSEWEQKVTIALDGFAGPTDEEKCRLGKDIYVWMHDTAALSPMFFIRPNFSSGYMVRGSFHMLADKERVAWHPDHCVTLLSDDATEAQTNA
jgi:hypothetical protein